MTKSTHTVNKPSALVFRWILWTGMCISTIPESRTSVMLETQDTCQLKTRSNFLSAFSSDLDSIDRHVGIFVSTLSNRSMELSDTTTVIQLTFCFSTFGVRSLETEINFSVPTMTGGHEPSLQDINSYSSQP